MVFHMFPMFFVVFLVGHIPDDHPRDSSLQLLHSRGVALMDEPGGRGKGAEVGPKTQETAVNEGSLKVIPPC